MRSVFILADEVIVAFKHTAGRGSKQAGRGAGRLSQRDQKQPHTVADRTSKSSSTRATSKTRICKGCLVNGHLYHNCPDNPDRVSTNDT